MKKISILGLMLILSACTVYKLVPAGNVEVGDAYVISVDSSWSKSEFGHMQTYTKDGPALGAINVSTGVNEKEHLFSGQHASEPPPYKKDLSLIELQQFIHDSFVAIGAERIEFTEIRPEGFGKWHGIRAEFDYYTKSGLHKRGIINGAQHDGKFYYIMYHAPALHFFDKYKPDVEKIFQSVRTETDA